MKNFIGRVNCISAFLFNNILYMESFIRDYREQPELDLLSQSGIDDSEIDDLSIGARKAAEKEMALRDGLQLDDEHVFYQMLLFRNN
jgi:hypothetical protein